MTAYRLSPSRIARHFYHECERYLRYHATPRGARAAEGVPAPLDRPSPVTDTILQDGYAWEEIVVRDHLGARVHIAPGTGALHERTHDIRETLARLATLQPGEFLYQPTLDAPEAFLARYGLDPTRCRFPPCRPDLLHLIEDERGRRLQVIDIKASHALKASHRIQVALYGLLLRDVLAAADSPLTVDLDEGGVWLYGQPAPESLALGTAVRLLERFLRDGLPEILERPLAEVPWHLFFRCEWCEFFGHCRQEAEATRSVSLLPYLSVGGRRFLREAPWGGSPIHTLDELDTFLAGPATAVDAALDTCGSLRGRRAHLQRAVAALRTEAVVAHGGSSLALPANEHVKIVLTLHSDPHSGQIYAAGMLRVKGKDVYGDGFHLETWVAPTPEACAQARTWLLETLFAELDTLRRYNAPLPCGQQKALQVYVFDGYELTLFTQMLIEALADPALAPRALQLLFYFQDESLAGEEAHPQTEVPYPVVVLTRVIRQLLALPQPLVLRLPEVLAALPAPDFDYTLQPKDRYWFALSNTLKSDALFDVWSGRRPEEALDGLRAELKRRLWATSTVVDGLRAQVDEVLFARPPRFLFPGARAFRHPEWSQLTFITRYESFLRAQATRESRTAPWDERIRSGTSIPVRCLTAGYWQVQNPLDMNRLEPGGFPEWLLVPAGAAGERAQMSYNDYVYRCNRYSQPRQNRWVAAVTDVDVPAGSTGIAHLWLDIRGQHPFKPGAEAVLHPRFMDYTSDRIVTCLGEMDGQPDSDLLALLRDPVGFARPVPSTEPIQTALEAQAQHPGLTKSQGWALRQLCGHRLTLVWGPPGTGKTYFLAQATLRLIRAYAQSGQTLRIGLTAFTHAAIENLLLEICKQQPLADLDPLAAIYKLKDVYTQRGVDLGLTAVAEDVIDDYTRGVDCIIGGTVYSFRKAREEGGMAPLDVLIVDEASQMKFGELALALPSLKPQGRLVLAGDDLQLPPIIQGSYPECEDGKPGLHDSIFAYLRARDDPARPYTRPLLENWRANDTLCRFPARELYGDGYRPATEAVRTRRIALATAPATAGEDDALVEWLLDPAYPLAIGVLEGVRATQENRVEAALVARLAAALRARLHDRDGATYPDTAEGDGAFWREGLFVVSPHHAQIDAIRRALRERRVWRAVPFVDTVDKMQGQESQTVIVSYGVSDPETAAGEGEFLYSLNRLNVAVTRARAKCVAFLPRPLLEPCLDVLQNDEAARGLGFMQALVEYARAGGQTAAFPLSLPEAPAAGRLVGFRRA